MENQISGADSAPGVRDAAETADRAERIAEPGHIPADPDQNPAEATHSPASPAYGWMGWVGQGLRAATLRPVRRLPDGPGVWPMLLLVAAGAVIICAASRFEIAGPASFDLRSWAFGWAPAAFLIFGVWLLLNASREKTTHASPVAAWYLLFSVAMFPLSLIGVAVTVLIWRGYLDWWSEGGWVSWAAFVVVLALTGATTWRVSRAVTRSTLIVASLVVYVIVVETFSSWQLYTLSWQPVFSEAEAESDDLSPMELSQNIFESQQALLNDSLQAITPSTGSERQAFGLIYAPYSQDVFLRESKMVQSVLEERLGAQGHFVRLVNNRKTAEELPWATPLNLKRSLSALAKAMDTQRDVLVLYLTSHGGADFTLAAQNWPLKVEHLTAKELRTMLDELGIRNRVIAVSACYSGGWIEPLQSDDTLVMTAADKDHTSYGCGSKSELTFFGRAVFDEQFRKTLSFEEAFNAAIPVIKQREIEGKKKDGFSNPQISVGKSIRAVLDDLTRRSPGQ